MRPRTYSIQTLGCRVNQYEAEQLAALLRSRGLSPAGDGPADLRVLHTCSVTVQAAGKSRQSARRIGGDGPGRISLSVIDATATETPVTETPATETPATPSATATVEAPTPDLTAGPADGPATRVILTGCWATSDPAAARNLPGVDAVITHHDDVAAELDRLLRSWQGESDRAAGRPAGIRHGLQATPTPPPADRTADDADRPSAVWFAGNLAGDTGTHPAGRTEGDNTSVNRPLSQTGVNGKIDLPATPDDFVCSEKPRSSDRPTRGFATLPLLSDSQTGRQRALLKIQDGCDAHCTYCIIPQLRSNLWSKSPQDAVEEARRLVAAGHVEIVLTGIFLGAYGQPTALRRRQSGRRSPLAGLVEALCTGVPGLRRLRLSSLEPGDLTGDLLDALRAHEQVVPHFHLPLQSGSDRLLRRMNRQYGRDDFLRMADAVRGAFDRPALTTDVIAGFPGEDDAAFADTADVVRQVGFIHVHAFHFSPRPRTAAARWQKDFVRGPVLGERVDQLRAIADENSLAFRRSFVGQTVELLVEHDTPTAEQTGLRHGRCERYFDVWFDAPSARPGDFVRVQVTEATPTRTRGNALVT